MTSREELLQTAQRLLQRDCTAQGIPVVCDDPATLAAVAVLVRPAPSERGDDRAR
jgi:hypothetical protein